MYVKSKSRCSTLTQTFLSLLIYVSSSSYISTELTWSQTYPMIHACCMIYIKSNSSMQADLHNITSNSSLPAYLHNFKLIRASLSTKVQTHPRRLMSMTPNHPCMLIYSNKLQLLCVCWSTWTQTHSCKLIYVTSNSSWSYDLHKLKLIHVSYLHKLKLILADWCPWLLLIHAS